MMNLRFAIYDRERTPLACSFRRRAENDSRVDDLRKISSGVTLKPTRGTRMFSRTK